MIDLHSHLTVNALVVNLLTCTVVDITQNNKLSLSEELFKIKVLKLFKLS